LFHYRSSKSIYEDKIVLPKLEGKIRAIFHGRYASKPELAGHIFSHPYMAFDDKAVTYFAHNGGVDAPGLPERKVDSEWALEEVMRASGMAAALPKLKEYTRSALNLLVLTIGREKGTPAALRYFHYFKPKEPGKVAYYQMFLGTMPGGEALVSSTITMPGAKVESMTNIRPANFDNLSPLEA
jgi:predicted glutamine amidotransferase